MSDMDSVLDAICRMRDHLPRSLNSTFTTGPARLGNIDSAVAMALSFGSSSIGRSAAEAYETLIGRMYACGLGNEQVSMLLASERRLKLADYPDARASVRLDHFAQYGYFPILLGEVLPEDELASQAFSYGTILNGQRWMSQPYGRHFPEMGLNRQRGLVRAAIELTAQVGGEEAGWPLERAMAAVMPYVEAGA